MKPVGSARLRVSVLIGIVVCLWNSHSWALTAEEESERLYAEGLIPFREGRYEEAREKFEAAAKKTPPYYLAVYYLGVTYGKLAERETDEQKKTDGYEQSRRQLESALALIEEQAKRATPVGQNPAPERIRGYSDVQLDLGVAYYHLHDHQNALAHLNIAEQLKPQDARIAYYKGLSQLALAAQDQEQLAAARQQFQRVRTTSVDPTLATSAEEAMKKIAEQRQDRLLELRAGVAGEFDSNVVLQSDQGPAFGQISHKDDFRFVASAGLTLGSRFHPASLPLDLFLAGQYDFWQSLHSSLRDFDLQAHEFKLTVQGNPYAYPSLILGAEGGTNFYRLGDQDYLHEIYGMPFLGLFEGSREKKWGYSDFSARFTNENYLLSFFDPARDGWVQEIAVRQYFLFDGDKFKNYLLVGYQYSYENPSLHLGNDFQHLGTHAEVGGGITPPGLPDTELRLTYFFSNRDYTFANSRSGVLPVALALSSSLSEGRPRFVRARNDDTHTIWAEFRQPLPFFASNFRLEMRVSYLATINDSNIDVFSYTRHIGSLGLYVTF